MKHICSLLILLCVSAVVLTSAAQTRKAAPRDAILVFSKTAGFRHKSIPVGKKAIMELGTKNNFRADTTEDASVFTNDNLRKYKTIVFLSTTGDILNPEQQAAFEQYIQKGGGFVGIHAAADTEYEWPWYNKLVGAYFLHHPKQQNAIIHVWNQQHPTTSFLPERWKRFDEWYSYKSIQPGIKVLATLDEGTYEGGRNGRNHPFIWFHEYDGGRAFYTGGGHTDESYAEPLFMKHVLEGIKWSMKRTK
ncbi:ThuA domain-containing protein [Telluribacter sp.]|jgi:type 1 glutamine amidotransferase|uniref:ThuA domain-containing protein n=1 Tax=Telluribacter sp. TaxID=1978767 RepID=UPI002E0D82BB|nr:ThuA domain-containing protein [Telluribacter sp.]